MKKHRHKWIKDAYDWGYICRCGAWTLDKKKISDAQHTSSLYPTEVKKK